MQTTASNIIPLSIAAATVPALIYSAIIYWFDHYEKEPWWLLMATFVWGALPSVALALLASMVFRIPFTWLGESAATNTVMAVLVAPPVEETVKAVALVAIFVLLRHEVDGLLDGIIYGAMVGMGFAMVENFFYFLAVFYEEGGQAWSSTVILRAVLFGLNHSLFSSATGLGLAIARFSPNRLIRFTAPVAGWSTAVALHAIHNLGASSGGLFCAILPFTDWGGVLLIVVIIVWALVQERRWIRTYLLEEVGAGTLTAGQYAVACSARGRLAQRLTILFERGPRAYLAATRFYRHCSELAYKKHHFELLQEVQSAQLTASLREEIRDLSQHMP